MKIEDIAIICHQANQALCEAQGDLSQANWDRSPAWQQESALAGVRFIRSNPDAGPDASHNSWMRQKIGEGWIYGPVKDPARLAHPCMVAYEQLPPMQQAKDHLFGAICRALLPFAEASCD